MIEYPISILEEEKNKLFDQLDAATENSEPILVLSIKRKIEEINFVIDYLEISKTLKGMNNRF